MEDIIAQKITITNKKNRVVTSKNESSSPVVAKKARRDVSYSSSDDVQPNNSESEDNGGESGSVAVTGRGRQPKSGKLKINKNKSNDVDVEKAVAQKGATTPKKNRGRLPKNESSSPGVINKSSQDVNYSSTDDVQPNNSDSAENGVESGAGGVIGRGRTPKSSKLKINKHSSNEDGVEDIVAQKTENTAKKGRGRPPKKELSSPTLTKKARQDVAHSSSDDVQPNNSDSEENGEETSPVAVTMGRGRPPKSGKLKINKPITATGKGRGRPKNIVQSPKKNQASEEEYGSEDEPFLSQKKKPTAIEPNKKPEKRGRPQKKIEEDDSGSDVDDENDGERRSVGRPPISGSVNLNISRTGRGRGRPKKITTAAKISSENNDNGGVVRKRGRPSTGNAKPPRVPTGLPRGRPKKNIAPQENKSGSPSSNSDPGDENIAVSENDDDDEDIA